METYIVIHSLDKLVTAQILAFLATDVDILKAKYGVTADLKTYVAKLFNMEFVDKDYLLKLVGQQNAIEMTQQNSATATDKSDKNASVGSSSKTDKPAGDKRISSQIDKDQMISPTDTVVGDKNNKSTEISKEVKKEKENDGYINGIPISDIPEDVKVHIPPIVTIADDPPARPYIVKEEEDDNDISLPLSEELSRKRCSGSSSVSLRQKLWKPARYDSSDEEDLDDFTIVNGRKSMNMSDSEEDMDQEVGEKSVDTSAIGGDKKELHCSTCWLMIAESRADNNNSDDPAARLCRYKCMVDQCDFNGGYYSMMKHHQMGHEDMKVDRKGMSVEEKKKLQNLLKKCASEKEQVCELCEEIVISNRQAFRKHAISHVGFRRYKCKEEGCNFQSKFGRKLFHHGNIEHGKKMSTKRDKFTAKQESKIDEVVKRCFPMKRI